MAPNNALGNPSAAKLRAKYEGDDPRPQEQEWLRDLERLENIEMPWEGVAVLLRRLQLVKHAAGVVTHLWS